MLVKPLLKEAFYHTDLHETHRNKWRLSIPNFVQICQEIWKLQV